MFEYSLLKLNKFIDNDDVKREFITWKKNGMVGFAPHIVKRKTIVDYASVNNIKVLVETGSCHGDMINAMLPYFDKLYSIELYDELYNECVVRFKNIDKVTLLHGDSTNKLYDVMYELDKPAIFWLDGHYSGEGTAKGEKETPIIEELNCILRKRNPYDVILIDDARCFGSFPDYPSIINLCSYIRSIAPDAKIEIKYDIIRIIFVH